MMRGREIGSFRDLGWVDSRELSEAQTRSIVPALRGAALFGSGRAALRRLLAQLDSEGRKSRRIVHVPSYYCPEVVVAVEAAGWEVRTYRHTPFEPVSDLPPYISAGDVLINANLFGVFHVELTERGHAHGMIVIEDHSHDPLDDVAMRAGSHLAFASLRKALPIVDGGVVYHAPFAGPTPVAIEASEEAGHDSLDPRLLARRAMELKARYLAGDANVAKSAYLELYAAAEHRLASVDFLDLAMSSLSLRLLDLVAVEQWREAHAANARWLRDALARLGIRVVEPTVGVGFGAFADFGEASITERVRDALIAQDVYPARLWLLPSLAPDDPVRQLAERSLFLHTDERYDRTDMERVVKLIRGSLGVEGGTTG
jgi:hypothetical protein